MIRYPILAVLLCLIFAASNIFWIGCSPEAEKGSVANNSQKVEDSKADSQPPVPVVNPAETGPGKTSTTVETYPENTVPTSGMKDADSGDHTLPQNIILLSKLWKTYTRGPVRFTHENHIKVHKIGCSECHHIYKNGGNVWKEGMPVAKCETCHNEPTVKGEKKLPPEDQKRNLKLAFHGNCRGCHKEIKKGDPETKVPLTCNQCHEKKLK